MHFSTHTGKSLSLHTVIQAKVYETEISETFGSSFNHREWIEKAMRSLQLLLPFDRPSWSMTIHPCNANDHTVQPRERHIIVGSLIALAHMPI
jgi:hypothetical protein